MLRYGDTNSCDPYACFATELIYIVTEIHVRAYKICDHARTRASMPRDAVIRASARYPCPSPYIVHCLSRVPIYQCQCQWYCPSESESECPFPYLSLCLYEYPCKFPCECPFLMLMTSPVRLLWPVPVLVPVRVLVIIHACARAGIPARSSASANASASASGGAQVQSKVN